MNKTIFVFQLFLLLLILILLYFKINGKDNDINNFENSIKQLKKEISLNTPEIRYYSNFEDGDSTFVYSQTAMVPIVLNLSMDASGDTLFCVIDPEKYVDYDFHNWDTIACTNYKKYTVILLKSKGIK